MLVNSLLTVELAITRQHQIFGYLTPGKKYNAGQGM